MVQTCRLLLLRRCDILAQNPDRIAGSLEDLSQLQEWFREMAARESCFTVGDLAVSGTDLIGLGMKPGPAIGRTLKYLLDLVLDEKCENDREAILCKAREAARESDEN